MAPNASERRNNGKGIPALAVKRYKLGPAQWFSWLILHLQELASQMSAGSSPSCSTSHPALGLWPGKAAKGDPELWDPTINVGDPEEASGS